MSKLLPLITFLQVPIFILAQRRYCMIPQTHWAVANGEIYVEEGDTIQLMCTRPYQLTSRVNSLTCGRNWQFTFPYCGIRKQSFAIQEILLLLWLLRNINRNTDASSTKSLSDSTVNDEESSVSLGACSGCSLPNSAFSTSGSEQGFEQERGRFNTPVDANGNTGWSPVCCLIVGDDYIQVDLGSVETVSAITTQGGQYNGVDSWVTRYKVKYGITTSSLQFVQDGNGDMEFVGNLDANTPIKRMLPTTISARYIRIYPLNYFPNSVNRMTLRFDVIGK